MAARGPAETKVTASQPLVGRHDATRLIGRLVATTDAQALIIEGEPGMGKSTLFDHGLDLARQAGRTILLARRPPLRPISRSSRSRTCCATLAGLARS